MPLDLRIHPEGHACSRLKLLQHRNFLIELLSVSVHALDHIRHITDSIGVESHADDHPGNGEHSLTVGDDSNVTETHCCDRLQSPVKGHCVLETYRLANHSFLDHPAVVGEVLPLGLEEPEASDEVCQEEHSDGKSEHARGSTRQIEQILQPACAVIALCKSKELD